MTVRERSKMQYKFTIDGRLDGQNDFIEANRTHPKAGNKMKQENQQVAMWAIRQQLKRLKIEKPIHIHYKFIEKNRMRDKDNIASFAMKVIQDALVQVKVIKNDGWREVESFSCTFGVDKNNPRIEVTLEEAE